MSKTRRLCLYLHTHWDREWYLAFEEYRTQLTLIVDEIVKELETGTLPSFMLDGQSCVLEDLEQVDPTLTARISLLMASGKMEAGPWYVLADQLLVSGESLMRNLEMGLAVTRRFGQPSLIGYCPDTFGHSRDLPRILQSYGITTAIVWRGVPDLAGKSLFWWSSSDGSKVLTYHLSKGYYQTAFFENRTAENLAEHLLSWRNTETETKTETRSHGFDSVLVPVGGDHLSAPRAFVKQLQSARLLTKMESLAMAAEGREGPAIGAKANKDADPLLHPDLQVNSNVVAFQSPGDDHCLIEANSLRRFVELMLRHAGGKGSKIPTLSGELRDNASALQYERAYMLQGVLSSRLYLKRENRLSERRLARVLEPAFAFLHCEKLVEYPTVQLNYAWRLLMQNHPHDSICGCSVDEVHREMMHRTENFHQVLNVLERRAVETLYISGAAPDDGTPPASTFRAAIKSPLLIDPLSTDHALVLFNLSGQDSFAPVPLSWCEPLPQSATLADLAPAPSTIERRDFAIQLIDRSIETLIFTGSNQIPETKKVLVNRGWIAPKAAVPAFGYRRISFKSSAVNADVDDERESMPSGSYKSVENKAETSADGAASIYNDFFTLTVAADGSVKVTTGGGAGRVQPQEYVLDHRFRDIGDGGDTYNFDPIEGDEYIQARFIAARNGSEGPLVKSILLEYELDLPSKMDLTLDENSSNRDLDAGSEARYKKSRSATLIPHKFITEIELRQTVPIVFFETRWENHARDHRLEVIFNAGKPVERVLSENHFSVIERNCHVEQASLPVARGTEAPLDRYPCQRFFIANGQVFFNLGLPEFGATGSAVSMTILRAVSALSRADLRTRGGGAGPAVETPEANCLGRNKVNYGWAPLHISLEHVLSAIEENEASNVTSALSAKPRSNALAEADLHNADDILPTPFNLIPAGANPGITVDNRETAEIARAYELAEEFEALSWTAVGTMPTMSKSFLQVKNRLIKVVAARVVPDHDFIEFRLLNISMRAQATLISVSINHSEALLTTADGRVVEILNPLEEDETAGLHADSISCAPDTDDFMPHASYKMELGVNATISIRLRLQSRQTKPRAGA